MGQGGDSLPGHLQLERTKNEHSVVAALESRRQPDCSGSLPWSWTLLQSTPPTFPFPVYTSSPPVSSTGCRPPHQTLLGDPPLYVQLWAEWHVLVGMCTTKLWSITTKPVLRLFSISDHGNLNFLVALSTTLTSFWLGLIVLCLSPQISNLLTHSSSSTFKTVEELSTTPHLNL